MQQINYVPSCYTDLFIGNINRFYIVVQFIKCTGNQRVLTKIILKCQHMQAISRSRCTDQKQIKQIQTTIVVLSALGAKTS